jgi:hypothetical protein
VRLIQENREFAEYSPGLRHFSYLDALFGDCYGTLFEDQQPACPQAGSEHNVTGLKPCHRKGGEAFLYGTLINQGHNNLYNAIVHASRPGRVRSRNDIAET